MPRRVCALLPGPAATLCSDFARRPLHLLAYMDDDWRPEEPTTKAAYEPLPEWVRWNGEQAGVPRHLIERSAAVAEGQPWTASECPAFEF